MEISSSDLPRRLLEAAVRRLPNECDEWGQAMLAELAQLQNPSTRWQFALGCSCVAMFPPRKPHQGEWLQSMMNNKTKHIFTTLKAAALISFLLVLPFGILESMNNTITRQNAPGLIVLFGLLWLLPIAFFVILMPMVRTVRVGNKLLAHPISLLLKILFLAFIAVMWGGVLIDQLPCFLGVPNCD